jgi:uncharacterized protein (TIGR02246 family)
VVRQLRGGELYKYQEEKGDGKMAEEVRKAIEKANLKWCEGLRQGNAVAVAALYTDDAILLPPNSEMIRGRQGIEKFWRAVMQMGVKDGVLTTGELSGSGDTIHEIGNYTLKIHPEGQKPIEDKGKYIVIWKHTASGWKLHRDIWNTNLPPQK